MFLKNEEIIQRLQQKPTEENLHLLPLFSGRKIRGMTPEMLHKSYHPDVSVSSIMFNHRAGGVLKAAKIRTIGELLLTSYVDLLLYRNCGVQTAEVFLSELKNYILNKKYDYSPYWVDIESMLRNVITLKERNFNILLYRLGVNLEKPYTLQQCGDMYGITREAVRQALNQIYRMIRHPEIEFRLRPFWTTIDKTLQKRGIMVAEDLSRKIKDKLSWKVKPESHAIEGLLKIKRDKYTTTFNHLVGLSSSKCFKCDKLEGLLPLVMEGKTELPYREVYCAFYNELEKCCPQLKSFKKQMVKSLVELQIKRELSLFKDYQKKPTGIINQCFAG